MRHEVVLDELSGMLDRGVIHSHAGGVVCSKCHEAVRVKHGLSHCPHCEAALTAVVVNGGIDIELPGRPTYYVTQPVDTAQAAAS